FSTQIHSDGVAAPLYSLPDDRYRRFPQMSAPSTHTDTAPSANTLDKIGQIAITVDDLPRARDFYQNTLGMKFLFEAGNLAFFKCGDIRLMLSTPDKPGTRGGTILYFKVD